MVSNRVCATWIVVTAPASFQKFKLRLPLGLHRRVRDRLCLSARITRGREQHRQPGCAAGRDDGDDYDPVAYTKREAPAKDPRGTTKGGHRVIRGGSWFSVPPATPRTRSSAGIAERTAFFGVRLARDAPSR